LCTESLTAREFHLSEEDFEVITTQSTEHFRALENDGSRIKEIAIATKAIFFKFIVCSLIVYTSYHNIGTVPYHISTLTSFLIKRSTEQA